MTIQRPGPISSMFPYERDPDTEHDRQREDAAWEAEYLAAEAEDAEQQLLAELRENVAVDRPHGPTGGDE